MKKVAAKEPQPEGTPVKQLSMTKRNFLADRLFDRPNMRVLSQDKRPKIFSNQSQDKKLTPSITKAYKKKISQHDSLPPIQMGSTNKRTSMKMKTQMSEYNDPSFDPKIADLKKQALDSNGKKDRYYKIKQKQMMNRTKMTESRYMNKTLTESREVIALMDKLKGSYGEIQKVEEIQDKDSPIKKFGKMLGTVKPEKGFYETNRRVATETKLQTKAEELKSDEPPQEIDAFIDMTENGKISDFEFYYLIKKETNDYYNMEFMTYANILKQKIQNYFTLSSHGLTLYEMARPIEFQSLEDWIMERKQFNELKQLLFFKKFRKWKSLKKWMTILSQQKLRKISGILSEKLFFLQPQYRSILLKHSHACYDLEQFKFIDMEGESQQIDAFYQKQQNKKNHLISNLRHYSTILHENSNEGLKEIVEEIKNQILGEGNFDQVAEKKEKILDEKTKILTEMGFPASISYGNRSRIRAEFLRFLRLAYLLDFFTIESLGRMFVMNIEYFKEKVAPVSKLCSYNNGKILSLEEVVMPKGLKFGETCNPDGKNKFTEENSETKPIFDLGSVINVEDLNKVKSKTEKIEFGCLKEQFMNFDLNGIIREDPDVKLNNSTFQYQFDTPITHRFSENLSEHVIVINPNKKKIIQKLVDFFTESLDSIQILNKWAKNEEFSEYVGVLEEWDEPIGENWEKNDQKYLNPVIWIRQHPQYRCLKSFIKSLITNSYSIVEKLISQHNPVMNMFVNFLDSDFQVLKSPDLEDQGTVFETTYENIIKCQQFLKKYLFDKVEIELYSVNFSRMKKQTLEKLAETTKKLVITFGSILKERSKSIKDWFTTSISELSSMVVRIQEFVVKKTNLDRIQLQLVNYKEKLRIVKGLLDIVEGSIYSGVLTKEEKSEVNQLTTLSAHLNNAISETQNQMPKYIQLFRKEIRLLLEKFEKESEQIRDLIKHQRFTTEVGNLNKSASELNALRDKMKNLDEYSRKHRKYEEVLEITDYTNFKDFRELKTEFTIKQKLFSGAVQLQKITQEWNQKLFNSINIKDLNTLCEQYNKDLMTAERQIPDNKAIPIFKKRLSVLKDAIPVITALRCPYLEDSDYLKIQKLLRTEIEFKENEQLTLGEFLILPFQEEQENIVDISVWATQYFYLKKQLDGFETQWTQTQLKLKKYKDTSEIIIVYEIQELTAKLDESLAVASNLLSNRYIGALRERAEKILNQIILAQQIIEKIVECQKKWVYLENIFSAQDIKKQLMVQAGQFTNADKFLKGVTKKFLNKPLITKYLKVINLLNDLTKTLQTLEEIQKKLEDYLEVKRRAFPRFYFISNDELVEILANSANMRIVQKHINKLFEGIGMMLMQEESPSAVQGMISQEGEVINFNNMISLRFSIQTWLLNMQKEMIQVVKRLVRDGYTDSINQKQKTRILWILNHKSQAVVTGNQIIWSQETQYAIKEQGNREDSLGAWYRLQLKQLKTLTQQIQSGLKDPIYHKIAVALITADVHNRDIVYNLMINEVDSIYDFNWHQQLKYSIDDGEHTIIRQVNAIMDYGYEYLGATSRLVITPLTDKCWITITSAIANHLGASPAGPAGTGKTESTKDLAKGLARVCIVFNCSDQITAQMMSKLFSGLAQQGAWACLDQFNRIDIQVLSVIAQQLFSVRVGLKKEKGEVELDGRTLPIKKNFGVFITMNPGYAGRTELPDNLKSLFRPVSMMIPDYTMIAEIMLFAEGFVKASELSKKMVQLYKLASEQLSPQKHYDFGLRAVKSLLVMAGQLRRSNPQQQQEEVLIKAMKDSNIPKFLANDIYLFEALVTDLFPKFIVEQKINEKLQKAAFKEIKLRNLGNEEFVSQKVIQLYEVLNIRFGVMIVGEAGVGKTQCYRILKHCMSTLINQNPDNQKLYKIVQERVINPKSVSMGQLYGQIDPMTQEWTDGLLSSVMRECNNCQKKGNYWITLDGPVDAMWIQNLNTVLDDNMTLCLANGQRIKLRIALRMLFEVQNLEAASPATVSRCGMVYIGTNKNYLDYITLQLSKLQLEDDYKKHLKEAWFPVISALIERKKEWTQPIPTIQLQVAHCFIVLLKYFLKNCKIGMSYEQNIKKMNFIAAYCVIWSVGSSIESESYGNFQTLLRSLVQNVFLPKTQTIFDFFVNHENQLSFVSWESQLTDFQYPKDVEFNQILVPTINTLKYLEIFKILLEQEKSILFTGESGVGKTSLTVPYLFKLKQQKIYTMFLNFSAKTKAKDTQFAIQSKLTKKGKTLFGARPNEFNVVFIDDINLPELQKEGAQPTIQLLRNFIDYGGFYDRHKLFWKQIVDTMVISCGATPSGGRNKLNPRFVRHSMVVCLPEPSQSNLKKIFGSILKGFLNSQNFNENIKKAAEGIISATLLFYNTIKQQLLPIPSKFHYQFNLRDISKVFQGMLQMSVDSVNNVEKFNQVWFHEMERIFSDRLIDDEDRQWFLKCASGISKRFGEGVDSDKIGKKELGVTFTKILSLETEESFYEEVDDMKKINDYLQSKMYEYNVSTSGKLQLAFFKQAIQHILRISRILVLPRGNAMLIGVGGSGKQSLSKIASFISLCTTQMLQIGKGYNTESFRGDLQKISISAGVQGEKVCFLFLDTQIIYEQFLESINNMLNTGEVPNLFKKKEQIDDIINRVRPNAIKAKKIDSPQSIWSHFVSCIRSNLHIILCMSPAGNSLRVRARKFPSLINCCTIDWFKSWSEEALLTVAKKYIANMTIETDKQRESFVNLCTLANKNCIQLCSEYFFNERRRVQVTPKTFLDQLELFNDVLQYKYKEIEANKKILSDGLEKLYSTNDIVAKLKQEMTKLQPKLAEQCVKTEEFLKRLAIDKEEANVVEKQVEAEAAEADQQTKQIKVIKEDAQKELGKALPMLLQAEQALKKINKSDITEIKGYANPHPIVQMVMEAVCVLLGEKIDWASIKITMMEMNFLDRLKGYDKNNIPDKILNKLRGSYTSRAEFDPFIVGQKNLASKSLCMWCKAIDNYAKVAKEVQPKKKRLAELERVFEEKNKELFMKQKELNKVKEKVMKLQKECEETLDYKNQLQSDLDLTAKRLDRAEKLTSLLKDEGLRWGNTIENYKIIIKDVPAEAFLSSVVLSYLGPFTGSYRQNFMGVLVNEVKQTKIPCPKVFSLVTTLLDQITVRDWILEGLPNDPVSIDNAIIANKGKRYPLMIDPQSQANRWLKVNQLKNQLNVVTFEETHYLKVLQNSIKNGTTVLIEQVEETLESSIDNLLYKKVQKIEGMNMISLGDKKIPYDKNFYLFMTTKISNPKFLAEVFNKATVINFSITEDGLKDQLLAEVSKFEKPQIQQQRDDIIVKVAANKKFLEESQNKILKLLAESTGMVLDDIELIDTLESSKIKSKEVQKDLERNSVVEQEIQMARNTYIPVAIRGTILYFVIAKLCLIEPMYEFSLTYVKNLYEQGLKNAQTNIITDIRIKKLNESITRIMFSDVSSSLFEVHKKLYSFLICSSILRKSGAISERDWNLFAKGPGIKPKNFKENIANPDTKFISPNAWYYLHKMAEIPQYSNILQEFRANFSQVKDTFQRQNVVASQLPFTELKSITNFTKLLLSKIIKPENLTFNMSAYVQKELGKFFDEPHVVTIEEVLHNSKFGVPILFVLSTGVDPTSNILNYCSSKQIELQTISLGQGQGKKAQHMIQRARVEGTWVLLNNCHLSKSWLSSLEKIIENIPKQEDSNQNFRMLLSSMPVSYFPSAILQNSNKITLEPPRGLKPNLMRSMKELSEDVLSYCPDRNQQWIRCLYSLIFFHGIVQQRRKYGSLGFNVRYQFNDSDLEMSVSTLWMFLKEKDDINWDAIWYMIGQINYGGRVTDDWDRVCLMSTLKKCLNPELLITQENGKFMKYYYADQDVEDYYCLACVSQQDFLISIDKYLPSVDTPEIFGLDLNANLTYIIQESNRAVECIQLFEPQGTGSSSGEGDTLQTISHFSVLPQLIDISTLPEHLVGQSSKILPPMTNFLIQQIQKFNKFLKVIKNSLQMLQKAVKGMIPMNQDLDQMMVAFSLNKIPQLWKKYCYETIKPLAGWFVDFKERFQFLQTWMQGAPTAYWISALFFPQGLLTALLQTHARKTKIDIDTLSFKFKVLDIQKEKLAIPKDGGYIYGLFFAGARWDSAKDTIAPEKPGQINEPMPVILFTPTQNVQMAQNQYSCPCYKTSARSGVLSTTGQSTNFILSIQLNTKYQRADHWTLKGAALICQLDD